MNVREELKAYYDNELTPAQAEEVRQALQNDPQALEELDEIARLSQVLRSEEVQPEPVGLEQTLEALTLGRRKLSPAEQRLRNLGSLLMATASVVVVAAVLFPVFAQSKSAARKTVERSAAKMAAMESAKASMPAEDGLNERLATNSKAESRFQAPMSGERVADAAFTPLVVKSASLGVEVDSVPQAQAKVEDLVRSVRGMIQASNRMDSGGPASLSMTLRVPVSRFEECLVSIRKLGKVGRDNVSGEDVTSQVADVEARLRVLRSEEEQYRTLLGRANKIGEILQVKERLGLVRQEIESLDSQQKALRSMSSMSTIQLTINEKPKPVKPAVTQDWSQSAWIGASSSLQSLWQNTATFGIYLLVFSPVWLPLGLAGVLLYRRRL